MQHLSVPVGQRISLALLCAYCISIIVDDMIFGEFFGVEPVILDDRRQPGLACIVTSACDSPDFAALHPSGQIDTESTNAWSSSL
jgi:hypothetical protein